MKISELVKCWLRFKESIPMSSLQKIAFMSCIILIFGIHPVVAQKIDRLYMTFNFDVDDDIYFGTPTIPVPTMADDGVCIPITSSTGPNKSIYIKTFLEEDVQISGNLYSQWVKIYIDWNGTGFGSYTDSKAWFGVVGSDSSNNVIGVDAVQSIGGPFNSTTQLPSNTVIWDANSLYLTTCATVRENFMHTVPEPGVFTLLVTMSIAGLFRYRRKKS